MKPLFTIHAGEFLVGEYISRKLGGKYDVWVPAKDCGIDLLVTRTKGAARPVRLQVKFSRWYRNKYILPNKCAEISRGWFMLSQKKIKISPADLWIFVVMTLRHETFYVVVPIAELRRRVSKVTSRTWNIDLTLFPKKQCIDTRGLNSDDVEDIVSGRKKVPWRDYSKYLDKWSFLDK